MQGGKVKIARGGVSCVEGHDGAGKGEFEYYSCRLRKVQGGGDQVREGESYLGRREMEEGRALRAT